MKVLTKALCLILLLASILSLASCGSNSTPPYAVSVETNDGARELTLHCDYDPEKFSDVTLAIVGLQTTKEKKSNDTTLENGHHRKSVLYALSTSNMTMILVTFKGKTEKDNVTLCYRAEFAGNYIVVKNVSGLNAA